MPFLRFARDKRGIETTALLHTSRRHGKGKPRLLYWFRTPPDVRVGRAAIDEVAISQLEHTHPDVTFDWPQILHASRSLAAAGARRGHEERLDQRRQRRRDRGSQSEPAAPAVDIDSGPARVAEDVVAVEPDRHTASQAAAGLVSHDDVSRLRGRHAQILARIAERISDPARADALRVQVEALNPDAWVTPEEVARGLEAFDRNEQQLQEQIGRRRRSRRGGTRRRRRDGTGAPPGASGPSTPPSTDPPPDAGR